MRTTCLLVTLMLGQLNVFAQDQVANVPQAAVNPTQEVLNLIGNLKLPPAQRRELVNKYLSQKPADDPRAQYAVALLAMHEKKNTEALKMVTEIASGDSKYPMAQAAVARLLLVQNKRTQAVAELQKLIDLLADPAPLTPPAELEHVAGFLGLAIGYFTAPGKDTIRPTTVADLVTAAERLPDNVRLAYESSKLAIEEEYRLLTEEGEQALKDHREKLEREANLLREQLESARAKAASESESSRLQLQASYAQLSSQWQNSWNASQNLAAQANDAARRQATLGILITQVPPPRQDSQGRVDPGDQARYAFEVGNLQNSIASLDYAIFSLANQYDRVRRQGLLIEQQMQQMQAAAQQTGVKLAMQEASFNQLDATIAAKKLAADKAEPKKKTSNQQIRERAFATYDDFNVYVQKKLIEDSLALMP